jgi:hypothetical protein
MKDWKTTLAGVLTILGSVCTAGLAFLHNQPTIAIGALTTGVPTGIGLIKAADSAK